MGNHSAFPLGEGRRSRVLQLAEISHPSAPISYPDRYQTVPVRQTASWTTGITWSSNHAEPGVGTYAREFEYDKVGNRTLMHLLDDDGDFVRDVTWTLEYNDFNQLDKRYTGASWSTETTLCCAVNPFSALGFRGFLSAIGRYQGGAEEC